MLEKRPRAPLIQVGEKEVQVQVKGYKSSSESALVKEPIAERL